MEMRNKVHTLFGDEAQRITTEEMHIISNEIISALMIAVKWTDEVEHSTSVFSISQTRQLPSKETHGDVDFVYIPYTDVRFAQILKEKFGNRVVRTHSNGDVYSVLFDSEMLGKKVHIDFIKATVFNFPTKLQYFSFNDFSGIVGMFSKKMHFKYGSEGFFKRFRDKRDNWHDIFISYDLMDGLRILGFDASRFETIKTVDDIISFMLSSDMIDSSYFEYDVLNQSDKKSMKRPVIEYVIDKIREANKIATITHEDYYLSKLFPEKLVDIATEIVKINKNLPAKSTYNGDWVMQKFGLSSGPAVGMILKHISNVFGDELKNQSEEVVVNEIYENQKRF